ncbi:CAMP phosphodiesterases class-II:Metallo-beta-lactamase superfamily [Rhodopirellula islandica]|uniref:cAMP phosphodiesterases class-II:Metallo-beta-lactamase superfamily n=1 Tax=Rhodopirellula islandica TaxID=595434 RepID=A0A0J1BHC9_RHOIS|nr:MBL fold metallo-hydrolase [Rhodopirellula islandica]KLU05918.1 CAMP phosphodiesterases class-II:Metallo-beta-lactamase superfamily [Rhodopirellula islandica]
MKTLEVHCLGTAGYHPNESRHTSCYFLPQSGVLLDAGTGIFRLPELIQTDHLDILLSHAHLDHVVGLTFLLDILYQRPVKEVRVWGQAEKLAAIQEHLFHESLFPVALPVSWNSIDEQSEWDLHGTKMSWRLQEHPGGSVAFRLEAARPDSTPSDPPAVLVYATDTLGAEDPETLQWMSGADLLMHECNFDDQNQKWAEKTGHCYLQKALQIAVQTQPQRLLLTHINPIAELQLDAEVPSLQCPIEIATDGLRVAF